MGINAAVEVLGDQPPGACPERRFGAVVSLAVPLDVVRGGPTIEIAVDTRRRSSWFILRDNLIGSPLVFADPPRRDHHASRRALLDLTRQEAPHGHCVTSARGRGEGHPVGGHSAQCPGRRSRPASSAVTNTCRSAIKATRSVWKESGADQLIVRTVNACESAEDWLAGLRHFPARWTSPRPRMGVGLSKPVPASSLRARILGLRQPAPIDLEPADRNSDDGCGGLSAALTRGSPGGATHKGHRQQLRARRATTEDQRRRSSASIRGNQVGRQAQDLPARDPLLHCPGL